MPFIHHILQCGLIVHRSAKKGKELTLTAHSFTKIDQHGFSTRWKISPAPGTNRVEFQPLAQWEKNTDNKNSKYFNQGWNNSFCFVNSILVLKIAVEIRYLQVQKKQLRQTFTSWRHRNLRKRLFFLRLNNNLVIFIRWEQHCTSIYD